VSAVLSAALDYAAEGLPVFPVVPGGKRPLPEHGFRDASTDPDVIRGWWSTWPAANVGMPTGVRTFDVLDVDVKHNLPGLASLRLLGDAGLLGTSGRVVRSPSGGWHVWFRPAGQPTRQLAKVGLDLRADGGCIALPPSIVEGRRYLVERDRPATGQLDWSAVVALLDPRPVSRIERTWDATDDVSGLVRFVENLTPGNRNPGTFWAACRAVEAGVNPRVLTDAAVGVGLPHREVETILRSAERTARVAA